MKEKKFYNKSFYKDYILESIWCDSAVGLSVKVTGERIDGDNSPSILNISIAFRKTLFIDSCRLHD